jgi:hypothetical protein
MMDKHPKSIRLGFELDCVEVPLELLHASRVVPPTIKVSVKYKQVKSSLAEIGLVEPLVVIHHPAHQGAYQVLDGHIRLLALAELGVARALCLISTDDEGYTYNKRVSRLSVVQEHKMIVRAAERGASVQRLAAALDISEKSIQERFRMLDGICDEAVRLLADKPAGRTIFGVLRKMGAFRQIDVARTMVGLENYSVKLAEAMLQHTPPDQLAPDTKAKVQRSGATETVQRLQRELAAMQADTKLIEETYGDLTLQLAIIKAHIKSLLDNVHVVRWLARFHNDYLQQLQLVAEIKRLPSE